MKTPSIHMVFVSIASLLVFAGCASVQDVHQGLLRSLRTPGETMEISAEETARAHTCTTPKLDTLLVLEIETVPERIHPGDEFNHRIRYAQCPPVSQSASHGEIIRTISYNDRALLRDRSKVEFKAGTWTVDAFIEVPAEAKPGTYVVETTVIYKGKPVSHTSYLQVVLKKKEP